MYYLCHSYPILRHEPIRAYRRLNLKTYHRYNIYIISITPSPRPALSTPPIPSQIHDFFNS